MICAIVLAAGRSERMGTQKLLLPFGGKPLITGIVDELLNSPVQQISVVLGRDAKRIQDALGDRPVLFLQNPRSDGDMLSSVRCGLRSVPNTCEAALVTLGDQPGMTRQLVAELIHAYGENRPGIVVPACNGKRGHPLLFSARFFGEVLQGFNGVGLHGLLQAHPDQILNVPVLSAQMLADMDTPEDYQNHRASRAN